ncbi:hypothetical protein Ciccas_011509, partial [Cichlidogyrus casuarinus]
AEVHERLSDTEEVKSILPDTSAEQAQVEVLSVDVDALVEATLAVREAEFYERSSDTEEVNSNLPEAFAQQPRFDISSKNSSATVDVCPKSSNLYKAQAYELLSDTEESKLISSESSSVHAQVELVTTAEASPESAEFHASKHSSPTDCIRLMSEFTFATIPIPSESISSTYSQGLLDITDNLTEQPSESINLDTDNPHQPAQSASENAFSECFKAVESIRSLPVESDSESCLKSPSSHKSSLTLDQSLTNPLSVAQVQALTDQTESSFLFSQQSPIEITSEIHQDISQHVIKSAEETHVPQTITSVFEQVQDVSTTKYVTTLDSAKIHSLPFHDSESTSPVLLHKEPKVFTNFGDFDCSIGDSLQLDKDASSKVVAISKPLSSEINLQLHEDITKQPEAESIGEDYTKRLLTESMKELINQDCMLTPLIEEPRQIEEEAILAELSLDVSSAEAAMYEKSFSQCVYEEQKQLELMEMEITKLSPGAMPSQKISPLSPLEEAGSFEPFEPFEKSSSSNEPSSSMMTVIPNVSMGAKQLPSSSQISLTGIDEIVDEATQLTGDESSGSSSLDKMTVKELGLSLQHIPDSLAKEVITGGSYESVHTEHAVFGQLSTNPVSSDPSNIFDFDHSLAVAPTSQESSPEVIFIDKSPKEVQEISRQQQQKEELLRLAQSAGVNLDDDDDDDDENDDEEPEEEIKPSASRHVQDAVSKSDQLLSRLTSMGLRTPRDTVKSVIIGTKPPMVEADPIIYDEDEEEENDSISEEDLVQDYHIDEEEEPERQTASLSPILETHSPKADDDDADSLDDDSREIENLVPAYEDEFDLDSARKSVQENREQMDRELMASVSSVTSTDSLRSTVIKRGVGFPALTTSPPDSTSRTTLDSFETGSVGPAQSSNCVALPPQVGHGKVLGSATSTPGLVADQFVAANLLTKRGDSSSSLPTTKPHPSASSSVQEFEEIEKHMTISTQSLQLMPEKRSSNVNSSSGGSLSEFERLEKELFSGSSRSSSLTEFQKPDSPSVELTEEQIQQGFNLHSGRISTILEDPAGEMSCSSMTNKSEDITLPPTGTIDYIQEEDSIEEEEAEDSLAQSDLDLGDSSQMDDPTSDEIRSKWLRNMIEGAKAVIKRQDRERESDSLGELDSFESRSRPLSSSSSYGLAPISRSIEASPDRADSLDRSSAEPVHERFYLDIGINESQNAEYIQNLFSARLATARRIGSSADSLDDSGNAREGSSSFAAPTVPQVMTDSLEDSAVATGASDLDEDAGRRPKRFSPGTDLVAGASPDRKRQKHSVPIQITEQIERTDEQVALSTPRADHSCVMLGEEEEEQK